MPISLRAIDHTGASTTIRYFVYTDIPFDVVATQVVKELSMTDEEGGVDKPAELGTSNDGGLNDTVKLLLFTLVTLVFVLIFFVAFVLYKFSRKLSLMTNQEETDGLVKTSPKETERVGGTPETGCAEDNVRETDDIETNNVC